MELSYILGNGNTEKIPYILEIGNPEKSPYISRDETFRRNFQSPKNKKKI